MDRYKTESVKKDTSNGFRDLNWSKYKRDALVPHLLKIFEKRQLVNATSADGYEEEFRGAILDFLDYCDNERKSYNQKNGKSLAQGELEKEYLDRILKMIEHLQGLYEVYYIDKAAKQSIIGAGDVIAFDREKKVQEVFSTLYNKEKMSMQDYQYIDDLVQCLKDKQKGFEHEFEEALNKMKDTKGANDNMEGIQAFKDSKYNSELETALKTFIQSRYQTATLKSQTTSTAYLGYIAANTWSWGQWLINDASNVVHGLSTSLCDSLLQHWVVTEGPRTATISTVVNSEIYKTSTSTTIVEANGIKSSNSSSTNNSKVNL